jgi:cold shock CspA family protein
VKIPGIVYDDKGGEMDVFLHVSHVKIAVSRKLKKNTF